MPIAKTDANFLKVGIRFCKKKLASVFAKKVGIRFCKKKVGIRFCKKKLASA
jgi:hypothetical protein